MTRKCFSFMLILNLLFTSLQDFPLLFYVLCSVLYFCEGASKYATQFLLCNILAKHIWQVTKQYLQISPTFCLLAILYSTFQQERSQIFIKFFVTYFWEQCMLVKRVAVSISMQCIRDISTICNLFILIKKYLHIKMEALEFLRHIKKINEIRTKWKLYRKLSVPAQFLQLHRRD